MSDLTVYSEGLFFASVCTSLTDDEATERMWPSGTRLGWGIAEEDFADGTPNGSPCPDNPDTHRHLLFTC